MSRLTDLLKSIVWDGNEFALKNQAHTKFGTVTLNRAIKMGYANREWTVKSGYQYRLTELGKSKIDYQSLLLEKQEMKRIIYS